MPKATKHANSAAAKIRAYLRANPKATPKQVSEVFGVTSQYVSVVKYEMKKAGEKTAALRVKASKPKATKPEWKQLGLFTADTPMPKLPKLPKVGDIVGGLVFTEMSNGKFRWLPPAPLPMPEPVQIEMIEPKSDPVNHPAHYKVGGIETIDFIEAKRLNYNMGNAVKYITRADHKGSRKQDLEKAIWYLKRELEHSL